MKRSYSIDMTSIRIDTKSLKNNIKLSTFASHKKWSLIDAVRLLDTG